MAHLYFITEKEFVPDRITHFNAFMNETEKGLYQIVYGVFLPQATYDDIYDLILQICKEQKSDIVKRFKLQAWLKEVDEITKKLRKLDAIDKKVIVSLPFLEYYNTIPFTLNQFELVKHIINEILEKGDCNLEVSSNPKFKLPIMPLDVLIDNFWSQYEKRLSIAGKDDKIIYFRTLLDDELYRRNFSRIKGTYYSLDVQDGKIANSYNDRHAIFPSEYYKQPERLFELVDLCEDHKTLKNQMEEEVDADESDNSTDGEPNSKEKAAILYFMLKDFSQDSFDKR